MKRRAPAPASRKARSTGAAIHLLSPLAKTPTSGAQGSPMPSLADSLVEMKRQKLSGQEILAYMQTVRQGGGRGPGGMGGTWDSKASCQLQQKASTHAFTHAFTHTPLLLTAPASPPFRTQEQQKIQLEQQKLQLEQQKLQLQQQQQQQERMQQRPGGGAMAGGGASRREARHNPFMSEDGTADPPPAFTVILC